MGWGLPEATHAVPGRCTKYSSFYMVQVRERSAHLHSWRGVALELRARRGYWLFRRCLTATKFLASFFQVEKWPRGGDTWEPAAGAGPVRQRALTRCGCSWGGPSGTWWWHCGSSGSRSSSTGGCCLSCSSTCSWGHWPRSSSTSGSWGSQSRCSGSTGSCARPCRGRGSRCSSAPRWRGTCSTDRSIIEDNISATYSMESKHT